MADTSGHEAERVVDHILRASSRLRELLAANFGEFGLNEVRYAVLRVIFDSLPAGCSQADLARHLDQTESSVSTLVERMREGGLLYRLRSKSDRRKRVLMLTDQGRQLHDLARVSYQKQLEALLARLEAGQTAMLAHLLQLLVDELSKPAAVSTVPAEAISVFQPGEAA